MSICLSLLAAAALAACGGGGSGGIAVVDPLDEIAVPGALEVETADPGALEVEVEDTRERALALSKSTLDVVAAAAPVATSGFVRPRTAARYYTTLDTPEKLAVAASFQLTVLNLLPSVGKVRMQETLAAIRTANPGIKLAQYVNLTQLQGSGAMDSNAAAVVQAVDQNDWWARNALGQRLQRNATVSSYELNPTAWAAVDPQGRSWPQWKAQTDSNEYFSALSGLDFVFTDAVYYYPPLDADWRRVGTNQSRKDSAVQAAYRAGFANYWAALKLQAPAIKVLANANNELSPREYKNKVEGTFYECAMGRPWSTETRLGWSAMMSGYRIRLANTLEPKAVVLEACDTATNMARQRYGMASALLEDGYFAYRLVGQSDPEVFDEYTVPLGAAVEAPPTAPTAAGIWTRRYSNGLVLVNPTDSAASIDVGAGYKRILGTRDPVANNGSAERLVALGPKQGLLMLKETAPPPPSPPSDVVVSANKIATPPTKADSTAAMPALISTKITTPAPAPAPAPAPVATEVHIYVDVNGSDAATGGSTIIGAADGPVKTLTRAQQLARNKLAAMASGSTARLPLRVLIGPGTYALTSTQTFSPADSGTAAAPVSYEARQSGTVLISGGVSLGSKLAPAAATAISFSAPTDAAAMTGGSQLYVNGRRAILARQPNAGSAWFVQHAVPLSTDAAGKEGTGAFAPVASNLLWLNALDASDRSRAIVDVMHSWTNSRHRVATIDLPSSAIRVAPKSIWPFLSFEASQRYFVENVIAALDGPGEWIYDSGNIKYIRRADETGLQVAPVLPILDKLFVLQGESPTKLVENLQFIGLSFAHTRYLTPATGFVDHQSATEVGAAIEVNKASGIVFDKCTVGHTGGWGIWLRDGARNSKVTNSNFSDTGAGGIRVGLASQKANDTSATGANHINGNTVTETGKLFPGAAAVWLGQTWDNQVQGNTIYRTSYSGISVGWSWGYAEATSGRNLIVGNLLYNIGQKQMSDLGGIYTLGISPGTVISNNIIREVRSYSGTAAWGIYNDLGSSTIITENNVVVGTDNGGYFLQQGRDNLLRNNLFAAGDTGEISIGRQDTGTNLRIQSNLFVSKSRQPFSALAKMPDAIYSTNEVSAAFSGPTVDLTRCGFGCTLSNTSITATPSPLSVSSSSSTWTAIIENAINTRSALQPKTPGAPSSTLPPVLSVEELATVPVASGLDLSIDIAGTAIGAKPLGLIYELGGVSSAMQVISKTGVPDNKCLAFLDGPQFKNSYEPMAYAKLNHISGITVMEFSIQIDSNTAFWHEWRDDGSPYAGGPTMFISSAKGIQVANKTVASVDVGQWLKFKVSAPMANPTGVWKLELTRANGEKVTIDNLPMKHTNFKRLNWLGFISNGLTASTPCIASIKASNTSQ